jgi:hypothetical protein
MNKDEYQDEDFVPFNESLELKELGLILDNHFGFFISNICEPHHINSDVELRTCEPYKPHKKDEVTPAILYQQAFRWFREKYDLHSYIEGAYSWFRFYINSEDDRWEGYKHLLFEEAELECLKKLIEICKTKK